MENRKSDELVTKWMQTPAQTGGLFPALQKEGVTARLCFAAGGAPR